MHAPRGAQRCCRNPCARRHGRHIGAGAAVRTDAARCEPSEGTASGHELCWDYEPARALAGLIRHLSEDSLVGWAWSPGLGRTPAPGTQAQFGDLAKAWVETGAQCPRA